MKRAVIFSLTVMLFCHSSWASCRYFRSAQHLSACELQPRQAAVLPSSATIDAALLQEEPTGPTVLATCSCDYTLQGSDPRCDMDRTEEYSSMLPEESSPVCRRGASLCRSICPTTLP